MDKKSVVSEGGQSHSSMRADNVYIRSGNWDGNINSDKINCSPSSNYCFIEIVAEPVGSHYPGIYLNRLATNGTFYVPDAVVTDSTDGGASGWEYTSSDSLNTGSSYGTSFTDLLEELQ